MNNDQPLDPARIVVIDAPPGAVRAQGLAALLQGSDLLIRTASVALDDEIALKEAGRERGLLVLGPGSPSAIMGGQPFGATSRVRPGNVAIVGTSASAMHEVGALLDRLGAGVSHALHVGPNDVGAEVGGASTLVALERLENDDATDVIAIMSRPPARATADAILKLARSLSKPLVICFVGSNVRGVDEHMAFVRTLHDAALAAAELAGVEEADLDTTPPQGLQGQAGFARALCTGAALAAEAALVFKRRLGRAASNVPAPGLLHLNAPSFPADHCALDSSDTDFNTRQALLRAAASDPATAVLLVDLVLGLEAPANPAAALIDALAARPAALPVIASVVGTDADPQPRHAQIAQLAAAGIFVAPSNALAATWAAQLISAGRRA